VHRLFEAVWGKKKRKSHSRRTSAPSAVSIPRTSKGRAPLEVFRGETGVRGPGWEKREESEKVWGRRNSEVSSGIAGPETGTKNKKKGGQGIKQGKKSKKRSHASQGTVTNRNWSEFAGKRRGGSATSTAKGGNRGGKSY